MADDLYLLSPSLKPCEPIDTTDIRYLNQSILFLLIYWRKLYILNYTMKNGLTNYFQPLFHLLLINMILLKCQLYPLLLFHQWLNFMKKLTLSPSPKSLFEKVDDNFSNPVSPLALQNCLDMTDHLSFIRYIPEDTIKLRWFLVQLNHHETEILKVYSLRTGYSHVTFLSRHHVD